MNFLEYKQMILKTIEGKENIVYDDILKPCYDFYLKETENLKNKNVELIRRCSVLKAYNAMLDGKNKKVKNKIKTGVKLTPKQIEFIKYNTQKYGLSREQMVIFFNEKFTKRKEPLTISQLRKIMLDNEIVKPKKSVNSNNNEMDTF